MGGFSGFGFKLTTSSNSYQKIQKWQAAGRFFSARCLTDTVDDNTQESLALLKASKRLFFHHNAWLIYSPWLRYEHQYFCWRKRFPSGAGILTPSLTHRDGQCSMTLHLFWMRPERRKQHWRDTFYSRSVQWYIASMRIHEWPSPSNGHYMIH